MKIQPTLYTVFVFPYYRKKLNLQKKTQEWIKDSNG